MSRKTIKVDYLARIEGEGAMYVEIRDGQVEEVKLKIFEPPRFFEAFLEGRMFTEAPDITSRICGICPIAYMMSACHAMESACGVAVNGELRALRRLLYCGEWIESHALHIFMLHLPDFLGYPDAIQMAKDHRSLVEKGLTIKKAGNQLLQQLGGREVHPVNIKLGGFYRKPSITDLLALKPDLEWGLEATLDTLKFLADLTYPDFERDYEFLALSHPDEYPFNEGQLCTNKGVLADVSEYDDLLVEEHVSHSTALHNRLRNGGLCFLGPMARYNLNFEKLTPMAQQAALNNGLTPHCNNPFKSIMVRAVEVAFAFEEALHIIDNYRAEGPDAITVEPVAGVGYGATEAPRGLCYHRYAIDQQGLIQSAKISPPTAVNQGVIEEDLYHVVNLHLTLSDEALKWQCEQAIRNYDPCISCAVHFLDLTVKRS